MKKTVILILIMFSLLFASVVQVYAADENKMLDDPENDVISAFSNKSTSLKPNIDIINFTYSKDGKQVTLTIKVKGKIENKGDIDDFLIEEADPYSLTFVMYAFYLDSSDESYSIIYINGKCNISDGYDGYDTSNFDVNDDTLTVWFNLLDVAETYDSLYVATFDWGGLVSIYADEGFDIEEEPENLSVLIYTEKKGNKVNFTALTSGGSYNYTWMWDIDNDGNFDDYTGQVISHVFGDPGQYIVKVKVIDNIYGTELTDTVTVTISDDQNGNNGSSTNGSNGENGGTSSGLLLFAGIIIIIFAVGIIIVIYIIRR